jgi:hypothetical protein
VCFLHTSEILCQGIHISRSKVCTETPDKSCSRHEIQEALDALCVAKNPHSTSMGVGSHCDSHACGLPK